jgi:hypothetical protein
LLAGLNIPNALTRVGELNFVGGNSIGGALQRLPQSYWNVVTQPVSVLLPTSVTLFGLGILCMSWVRRTSKFTNYFVRQSSKV